MDEESTRELEELIAFYETISPLSPVRVHQILTYGTDSDRILLETFVRFGRFVRVFLSDGN